MFCSFSFTSDPEQHICEVQLVHAGMLTARKHCNAHVAYAKFRSALELLETFGLMTPSPSGEVEEKVNAKEAGYTDPEQADFVMELERDYSEFLKRYHAMMNIKTKPGMVEAPPDNEESLEADLGASDDTKTHGQAGGRQRAHNVGNKKMRTNTQCQ